MRVVMHQWLWQEICQGVFKCSILSYKYSKVIFEKGKSGLEHILNT